MKNPFSKQTIRIHNLNDANVKIRTFYYFNNLKIWESEKVEKHDSIQDPQPEFPREAENYLDNLINPPKYANPDQRSTV